MHPNSLLGIGHANNISIYEKETLKRFSKYVYDSRMSKVQNIVEKGGTVTFAKGVGNMTSGELIGYVYDIGGYDLVGDLLCKNTGNDTRISNEMVLYHFLQALGRICSPFDALLGVYEQGDFISLYETFYE